MVCDCFHTQHAGKFTDSAFRVGFNNDERYGAAGDKHQGYLEIRPAISGNTTTRADPHNGISFVGYLASRDIIVMDRIIRDLSITIKEGHL